MPKRNVFSESLNAARDLAFRSWRDLTQIPLRVEQAP